MIIFHEGMPRSGKSYAAMKDHILPALAKGRKCYVRIDGLNYKQIADLAGISQDEIKERLFELTEEQCHNLAKQDFEQDAFIFIDEAQNYWPRTRKPAESDLMTFVAEHGHHGHDILLMGQLAKDVHTVWINRCNRKVQFIKKDVVGKADEYKWIMFHGSPDASGNVKFREVSKGDAKYDDRYFGTYKSHSDGTENKENYVDDRANIFKTAVFKKWVPIYIVVAVGALGFVIYAFSGGLAKTPPKPQPAATAPAQPAQPIQPAQTRTIEPDAPKTQPGQVGVYQDGKLVGTRPEIIPANTVQPALQPDYIEQLTNRYRIRLTGVIQGSGHSTGIVEWRDESDGIKEQLTFRDVSGFGWLLLLSPDGTVGTMTKADRRYIVTAWPLQDTRGRLTEQQTRNIQPAAGAPAPSVARADAPALSQPPSMSVKSGPYNVAMSH